MVSLNLQHYPFSFVRKKNDENRCILSISLNATTTATGNSDGGNR